MEVNAIERSTWIATAFRTAQHLPKWSCRVSQAMDLVARPGVPVGRLRSRGILEEVFR
jgi:hypothetical protein